MLNTTNTFDINSREYWLFEQQVIDSIINDPDAGDEAKRAAWDDRVFVCKQLVAFDIAQEKAIEEHWQKELAKPQRPIYYLPTAQRGAESLIGPLEQQ